LILEKKYFIFKNDGKKKRPANGKKQTGKNKPESDK